MKGGAHPSPFAAFAFPRIRKRYPFTAGLTERVFQSWRSPAPNSQPYGVFLHHNRAALTTRPRRLSWTIKWLILLTSISESLVKQSEIIVFGSSSVTLESHWAFGAKMTSYRRRCDVITSHRRLYDVIFTSCARWEVVAIDTTSMSFRARINKNVSLPVFCM